MIQHGAAWRIVAAGGIALLGAGCGSFLKSSAATEQIYVLQPVASAAASQQVVDALISVARPLVQPGLATSRIALTQPGNRLNYFAASRWGESLPQVVSALATQSLRASGRFALVAEADIISGGANYELLLTVRHFEAEYSQGKDAPSARVSFECLLSANLPHRAIGRCDSEALVPASENRMEPIVAALEQAAQKAMSEAIGKAAELAAAQPVKRQL